MSFNVTSTCRQRFWNVFYSYDVSSKIEPFYKGGKVQVSLCYLSKAFILLKLKRVVAVWMGWLEGGGHASDEFKLDVLIAVRGDQNIFTFSLLPCPCGAPKLSRNNPDIRIYLTCNISFVPWCITGQQEWKVHFLHMWISCQCFGDQHRQDRPQCGTRESRTTAVLLLTV